MLIINYKIKSVKVVNEYTDTRAVYPNTFEYPGSLIRANQIEVQYRHSDVMCLEQVSEKKSSDRKIKFLILNKFTIWFNRNQFQLTITEGNYRINLIADWDQKAFNIEKYPYKAQKPAWRSLTGTYTKTFFKFWPQVLDFCRDSYYIFWKNF